MSNPIIHGTAGDDSLTGTSGNDFFALGQGGSDSASGLGGNDTFSMQAALDAGDQLNGGAGNDVVVLNGDYSGGLTFEATTLTSIETLRLSAGFSYELTSVDATVAAGAAMTVDGSRLGAGDTLAFDGSSETDGLYHLIGGAGDDVLKGGADGNTFNLAKGGEDTATGGAGNDIFTLGATLDAGDKIDGGAGNDRVAMDSMGAAENFTFSATTMVNVETLTLQAGHDYDLITNDATVAAGATLLVAGNTLGAGNTLTFDGSAETDGHFIIRGGAGNDALTGGAQNDTFNLLAGGNDTAHGGGGNDVFDMGSTLTASDALNGGAGSNIVELSGNYAGGSALVFGATTMVSVQTLDLAEGGHYDLTTNDATVASGRSLTIDATALAAGDTLTFDGAAETNGSFTFDAGAGGYALTGGAGSDIFEMGAHFAASDHVDGGAGVDTLFLDGDYASGLTFGAATMIDVATLHLDAGHSYELTTDDANIAAGAKLRVDASALGAGDSFTFDGSAETDGAFTVYTGAGLYHLTGGDGEDYFHLGDSFTNADSVDGGNGVDHIVLAGDYTAAHALTLAAGAWSDIEVVALGGGDSYDITSDVGAFGPNTLPMTITAYNLEAGDTLTFDGSAETSVRERIFAGFGTYDVKFGASDDFIAFGGAFGAADSVGGGGGTDTLGLNADFQHTALNADYTGANAIVFGASQLTSVETLGLTGGYSYDITMNNGNVAAGATLTVAADGFSVYAGGTDDVIMPALAGSDKLTFNGAAETDGFFNIVSSAGSNILTGGALADTIDVSHEGASAASSITGGGGADMMTAGAGADVFIYSAASQSTNTDPDVISGFNADADSFAFGHAITTVNTASGTVNDLSGSLGLVINDQLHTHGAVVVTATGGTFAGDVFLVVDGDGNSTYDAGSDYVINITGASHLSDFGTGNFI